MVVGKPSPRLVFVVCALLQAIATVSGTRAPGRRLTGEDVVFGLDTLEYFGLPKGASLVLQSETNCPSPAAAPIEAKNALLCGTTTKMRSCLGVSNTEPLWTARNCTQANCVARNNYPETQCLLESYGIPIDIQNKSRSATCGLDPEDRLWLEPSLNFAALRTGDETVSCSVATPPGVVSQIWVDCVDGRPEFRYQLLFLEGRAMPEGSFTCVVNPTCINTKWKSMMACYQDDTIDGMNIEGGVKLLGMDVVTSESGTGVMGGGSEWMQLPMMLLCEGLLLLILWK